MAQLGYDDVACIRSRGREGVVVDRARGTPAAQARADHERGAFERRWREGRRAFGRRPSPTVDGIHQHERGHHVRLDREQIRGAPGRLTTARVTREHDARPALARQRAYDGGGIGGLDLDRVASQQRRHPARVEVGRDDLEARVGRGRHQLAVGVGRDHEAVQEDQHAPLRGHRGTSGCDVRPTIRRWRPTHGFVATSAVNVTP